jgi:hypothetical protein
MRFGIFNSSATIVAGKAKKSATIISNYCSLKTSFRLSFQVINGISS